MSNQELLGIRAAASFVGVTRGTISNWILAGDLKYEVRSLGALRIFIFQSDDLIACSLIPRKPGPNDKTVRKAKRS